MEFILDIQWDGWSKFNFPIEFGTPTVAKIFFQANSNRFWLELSPRSSSPGLKHYCQKKTKKNIFYVHLTWQKLVTAERGEARRVRRKRKRPKMWKVCARNLRERERERAEWVQLFYSLEDKVNSISSSPRSVFVSSPVSYPLSDLISIKSLHKKIEKRGEKKSNF